MSHRRDQAFTRRNQIFATEPQYGRMDNFKRVFRHTVDMVLTQYRAARIELDGRGMTLRNSPPPINGRMALIRRA